MTLFTLYKQFLHPIQYFGGEWYYRSPQIRNFFLMLLAGDGLIIINAIFKDNTVQPTKKSARHFVGNCDFKCPNYTTLNFS